jgi:hypothetical protein
MKATKTRALFNEHISWRRKYCLRQIVAIAFTLVFAEHASAEQGRVFTLYAGFRDGGSFNDELSGKSTSIDSSESYSISLDFPLDEGRQFQVFYSFQNSALGLQSPIASPTPVSTEFPLHVMYLQFGGTNYITGEVGHGAYAVGGLGATLFDPSSSGYDSELRLSANVGLGYQQPLSKRMALRFEARGYFTFINSSGGMFCSGGCTVAISGQVVAQGELSIGLAFGL